MLVWTKLGEKEERNEQEGEYSPSCSFLSSFSPSTLSPTYLVHAHDITNKNDLHVIRSICIS